MCRSVRAIILALLFLSPTLVDAQEDKPQGTPLARIFANYRQQLNGDGSYHGFDVTRAYMGYKYKFDSKLSAQILVDIGKPLSTDDVSSKRYAFLKNALIQYKVNSNLTLSAGITEVKGSSVQNSYWGRKYVRQPYLLQHKFMNSADLGITADYKISDMVSLDVGVFNGEGYAKIQADDILQYAIGLTIKPIDGLTLRLYGDLYKGEDASKNNMAAFAGYKNKHFSMGFEYNYLSDADMTDGNNKYGYSAFASVNIVPKLDLFGRYDNVASTTANGEVDPWNYSEDGSTIISGLQYSYTKYIKISLNYQGWTPADNTEARWDYIQVNALFRF